MPTFASLAAFERELALLGKEIETTERRRITQAQAEKMQQIAQRTAAFDLGADLGFTGGPGRGGGWRSKSGDVLRLDTQLKTLSSGATLLTPTRLSAGPWTVAERGRNMGNASGFAGPGISTKTGKTSRNKDGSVRKVRQRKAKQWSGYTRGKETATRAREQAEKEVAEIALLGLRNTTRKHFDVD